MPAELAQKIAAAAMGIAELGRAGDRRIEARQRLLTTP